MLSAGLCWANQSSQCGRAGWDGALGVGVSQRPQAGETLGRRLSGASSQQEAQGRQHWGRPCTPPSHQSLYFCGQGRWTPNQEAWRAPAPL